MIFAVLLHATIIAQCRIDTLNGFNGGGYIIRIDLDHNIYLISLIYRFIMRDIHFAKSHTTIVIFVAVKNILR